MASWSTESATKAYIHTLKMGRRGKEPNVAEFIAAGNNAQLMVVVCAHCAGSTLLASGAAAQETGGHAVCILPGLKELNASRRILASTNADFAEFVVGDAQSLLLKDYQDADFVLVDCRMDEHILILEVAQKCLRRKDAFLDGYNVLHCVQQINDLKAQILPIGEG